MAFLGVSYERLEGFADELIRSGLVSSDQLALAQVSQKNLGLDLGEILIRKGIMNQDQFMQVLADYLGVDWGVLDKMGVDAEAVRRIPASLARRLRILVVHEDNQAVSVAMADPTDSFAIEELEKLLSAPVRPVLVSLEELHRAWNSHYHVEVLKPAALDSSDKVDVIYDEVGMAGRVEELRRMASGRRVVETLNGVLSRAYDGGASDIHLEPHREGVQIRFRIDGLLEKKEDLDRSLHLPLVSRIKILAGMDIAERRLPQDGRIHVQVVGRPLDLRISSFPTLYGEKIVLRLLTQQQILRIEDLGFNNRDRRTFARLIEKSHGIFLVTGPTGSGKTTTLYAALMHINSPEKNILSVEDPIENQIEGVNQSQINPKAGLNFASALKSVLRQDPDIIMLGEIRDRETAEIAIRAAITGHLVLSTLHTNTAAGAIARLIDLGIEPFLVASALEGVMAQRLVRRVCFVCRQKLAAPPDEDAPVKKQFRGPGCEACRLTGFKGRLGIFELAPISEETRNLINQGASEDQILMQWHCEKIQALQKDGFDKVEKGLTTLEEVLSVTPTP